jgi:glycerate kinase
MEECLRRLSAIVAGQMGINKGNAPGAGAAGGLGWALMQCCGAVMESGIGYVLDAAHFDDALEGACLVITGEGRLDGQTATGKAPVGIAGRASMRGIPAAAIAGTLGEGYEAVYALGICCAIGIAPGPMTLADAMANAEELIERAAARLARIIGVGRLLGGDA